MNTAHRAVVLTATLVAWWPAAAAPTNDAVLAWAKRNADKYRTEEVAGPVRLGDTVTLRARLHPLYEMGWLGRYDAAKQAAVVNDLAGLKFLLFTMHERCAKVGQFTGQNSYGAKTLVRRDACEKFMLTPLNRPGVAPALELPMSPAQYRQLKSNWGAVDVETELAEATDGKLAEFADVVQDGTVSNPVQSRTKSWTIYGLVRRVDLVLKDGTKLKLYEQ